MFNRYLNILLLIVAALVMSACNPTRRLQEEEALLTKNVIIDKDTKLEKDEIEAYLKQKPNRTMLGVIRFHLGIYNMVDQTKMREKKIVRDNKIDKKNAKRAAKGKKLKSKDRLTFREWLIDIGEAPAILDSVLIEKSTEQIKLFLNSKGYFISSVKDSVVLKKKYATVFYKITAEAPYTIRNVSYKVEDESLSSFVIPEQGSSLIKQGDNYDAGVLQAERDRITQKLRNNGFYNFVKEYIYFDIDSALNSRQVDVSLTVKKYSVPGLNKDSITEISHPRYKINKIFIRPDYDPTQPYKAAPDTLHLGDYDIVFNGILQYKSKVLLEPVLLKKDQYYSAKNADNTYKRLSELKAFKIISVSFTESNIPGYLDAQIRLTPVIKQAFTLDAEATNSEGDLGLAGSYTYQNKNSFKGAEILQLKLKGAIRAVKPNTEIQNDNDNLTFFNTYEVGPELSLTIPRAFFPFNIFEFSANAAPKTTFTTAYNFQQRPDYTRSILNLSYGFTYRESSTNRHSFYPVEISSIKVNLTDAFRDALIETGNALFINRFTDHMATSSRYSFIFNNQADKNNTTFSFFRFNAEASGNILRGIHNLTGREKDANGSYKIFGIIYSQYLRSDVDFRRYFVLSPTKRLVWRTAFGVGKPLHNLRVLPLEKSFFGGGANSMRAWRARTLGPGSYQSLTPQAYDQIGDAQIEGNLEYRFNIIKMLNGAFFIDAGNIWLRKADSTRVGGEFNIERFYKEFAIGTGFGARVDFNFFIIRLDLGIKMRDPQFIEGERFTGKHLFDKKWKEEYFNTYGRKYNFLNINLGIGYPF